jgi:exodeoxyribonuclease VII large subunit
VTGQYQLYVKSIKEDGIGNLYLQFEQLKKRLEKEGLFDSKYKKNIPTFPKSIAVLSAKQGAAVQDILRTIHIRFPFTRVIVFPIPVQGNNAYLKIIETLKFVDQLRFDTIILARGGGSIEDLWNFNEEELARCIFNLNTPIITGIGHETDFTICDFVSDFRGVTPTAAAIKATPDQHELKKELTSLNQQLIYKMNQYLRFQSEHLSKLKKSYVFVKPEYLYSNEILRLTHLKDRLSHQTQIFNIKNIQTLHQYQIVLKQKIDEKISYREKILQSYISKLDALSPLKVMQRGYTLVKKNDIVIKKGNDLQSGDIVDILFYDSQKKAEIK